MARRLTTADTKRKSFIMIPKFVLNLGLSPVSLALYNFLLERFEWSAKNAASGKWVNSHKEIFFIFKREDMCSSLNCSKPTVRKAINQLKLLGLVEEERIGLNRPNRLYLCDSADVVPSTKDELPTLPVEDEPAVAITIQPDNTTDTLCNDISLSPDISDNIASVPTVPGESTYDTSDKNIPSGGKNFIPPFNNVFKNNTEYEQESIYQRKDEVPDTKTVENKDLSQLRSKKHTPSLPLQIANYRGLTRHELVTSYRDDYAYINGGVVPSEITGVISIIADTLCSTKDFIRVNGDEIDANIVKSRLYHLDPQDIEFVVGCVGQASSQIKNIRAYILTALYNVADTMDLQIQAEVNKLTS